MATRYSGAAPKKTKKVKGSSRDSKPRKGRGKITHAF